MRDSPQADGDEVQVLAASPAARTAAGLAVLTGFLSLLTGFQLLISVRFIALWARLAPWSMVVLGLATMYVGTQVYRMRGWAAQTNVGLMGLFAVGMAGWSVYAVAGGVFSCLGLFVPLTALAGAVTGLHVRKDCLRADEVRERMRDAGMDLGV